MIREQAADNRPFKTVRYEADVVIVGGGLSGVCCAITAARAGARVLLVQDRPVLGGNASSEVRLWVLGATSHMGNNNRWAREGGVVDELLLENLYRNPEGNPLIFDTILLEKTTAEPNIQLLLNTAVYEVSKADSTTISGIRAFCSQNSTQYELVAPLFCDASGDGVVAFGAGAAFRMGAEPRSEFDEKFAPTTEYGELLGHSIYFYTKDTGKPVRFVPPTFALQDITEIPRYRRFNAKEQGCQLWWLEYGGRLDTVHDTESIKWELWKVVYGVWNYIKNSGQFPEADTMTLEWVGHIPGKRESRRFEGDYMLRQQDVVEQRAQPDAVAYGGWSIDLHPADGIFSEKPGCNQWHSKGIYPIPYRCYYSRNIKNLFLAGRIISASHVAFGSSRVMGTCAHGAQAVGMAAALCTRDGLFPRDLTAPDRMGELQRELLKTGQHIPNLPLHDTQDLSREATITASSQLILHELPADGPVHVLSSSAGQMLPVQAGPMPKISLYITADQDTQLLIDLRRSSRSDNHTPDVILEALTISIKKGRHEVMLPFTTTLEQDGYVFVLFMKNEALRLPYSRMRLTGVLSVFNKTNPAVSNYGKQEPKEDIGIETFEFWCPERRPDGYNIAMSIRPGLAVFNPENLRNGYQRPTKQPNAYLADIEDVRPTITLSWPQKQSISRVELSFDSDYDHPLETVLMNHPETRSPLCVSEYTLCNDKQERIFSASNNYQSRNTVHFSSPLETTQLSIHLKASDRNTPPALMEVRCYS